MIIVFTPADGEPEHYDARSLRVSEASIVARTVDQTWPEIKQGLSDEDIDAMRGVVWVLKKRANPSLRFGEFDPGVDEMATRLDKHEVVNYVTGAIAAVSDPEVTGEQIAHALRELPGIAFDRAHAEAVIKEMTADPKGEPAAEPAGTQGGDVSPSET